MTAEEMGPITIRPPTAALVYAACVAAWVMGFAISALLSTGSPAGLVIVVPGALILWRNLGLGAKADGDGLTVRNSFTTIRLPAAGIEGFRLGTGQTGWTSSIFALTTEGGVVQLDVTRRSFGLGQRKLEAWLSELDRWLAAAQS